MKRIVCLLLCLFLLPLARAEGELGPGDEGDAVLALQQSLAENGFLDGEADGKFGKKTEAAVARLQNYLLEQGVEVRSDGVCDAETLKYLSDEDALAAWFLLKKGASGPLVRKLQQRLIELGFLAGGADGSFGVATEKALVDFQQTLSSQGVEEMAVDGVAGPVTRKWLFDSDLSAFRIITPATYDAEDPLSLQPGHLYCKSCVLIDADTGMLLFAVEPQVRLYPASTTKIMTLILALEHVNLDDAVTLPDCTEDVPRDSSRVPVYAGEEMTWRDLLHGLMIRSGNDAANAAACLVAGSVDGFVAMMNDKAAELGMTGTHYANPHGYHDEEHYTTALDMARLTRYALNNEAFLEIVSCLSYEMQPTARRGSLTLRNAYAILNPDAAEYDPDAFGIKTGYTSAAGRCYVGGARRGGHTLICAVFDSGVSSGHKFIDAGRLFQFGFAALEGR